MPSHEDPRYLLSWWGMEKVERVVRNPGKPIDKGKAQRLLQEMWSELKKLRWSGLPSDMAADMALPLAEKAKEMREVLGLKGEIKDLVKAQASWALWYVQTLPQRLKRKEEVDPGEAVDVFSGEIKSVEKHPNADKLKVTRVAIGNLALTVVTNIEDVKEGQVRAVALLPPADLRGVVSWGMFCSDPLDLPPGKPFPPYDKGAVGAQVEMIMREAVRVKK
ncbi:tRNA-binding protein [Ignicoccus pacificus DSM 13166]|uniref:tRNA-binding protein n=1 Tax=Ignicoccus pacificus DSM 13166 TaxID=940294 RepID=A0A977KAB0_9CREN|nr:tRNA-binding protein [Ignicoccus pacificus DSM 13166]